jgi:hypothetical protein
MTLIERMIDIAKGQSGADGGDSSHHDIPNGYPDKV